MRAHVRGLGRGWARGEGLASLCLREVGMNSQQNPQDYEMIWLR